MPEGLKVSGHPVVMFLLGGGVTLLWGLARVTPDWLCPCSCQIVRRDCGELVARFSQFGGHSTFSLSLLHTHTHTHTHRVIVKLMVCGEARVAGGPREKSIDSCEAGSRLTLPDHEFPEEAGGDCRQDYPATLNTAQHTAGTQQTGAESTAASSRSLGKKKVRSLGFPKGQTWFH
jgi:hypothetical protein